ncbi:MAG: hypothetical protein A2Z13_06680 [Deltaproteobacteria bacterium RBG_16_64_85]|nr:MAG: hypothetical protein A2Z13_06680 [Deltaproteobacteria bacterium RBG_16_64_85]
MTGTRNLRPTRPWVFLLLFGVLLSAGCSTGTGDSGLNLVTPSGSHPAGFLSTHTAFAISDTTQCESCHGSDLAGGIAKTSCFTSACHHGTKSSWALPAEHGASAKRAPGSSGFASCRICHGNDFAGGGSGVSCLNNAACHGSGVNSPHSRRLWRLTGTGNTHTNTDPANAVVCINCHASGANTNPPHPPPTPAPAGTPPGCFNSTLCHGVGPGGANHTVPFLAPTHTQSTQPTFTNDCSSCHAVTGTSPISAAPLCTVCHTAGSPFTLTNCTSCHAFPPNGAAGAAYPNIAGAHPVHIALNGAGTPISCDTCHNGLGTNTLNHYNRANARPGLNALRVPPGDAAFPATYNAKTGASSFSATALTCSNVSCHGGQANLNWQTGTLDVNTRCTSCHASGTAQFNSYNSGRHTNVGKHVSNGCTSCHDTARLALGHFTNLATSAFEQAPRATLLTGLQYNGATCNPGAGGISGCHDQKTW